MRSNPRTIARSMNMTTHQDTQPSYRVLRLKQVVELTGLSRSKIYDMLDQKSTRHDPTFPRSIHLTACSVGWLAHELDTWVESRIAISRT